jgi:hypothetical protein
MWTSSPTTTVTGGAPNSPPRLDVPARPLKYRVTGRGQTGEVGEGVAGNERPASGGGETEQLPNPL